MRSVSVSRGRARYRVVAGAEMRRRWVAGGVLVAVAAAAVAPRLGARGGFLRAEYSAVALACWVYYRAGRRWRAGGGAGRRGVGDARLHALCVAHAHLVPPALAAALLAPLRDTLDPTVAKGVMLWSRGGGCAWLSLSLSASPAAPALAALLYLVSLLVTPLATALFCGEASLPSAQSVAATLLTATGPFCAGAALAPPPAAASASGDGEAPSRGDKLCALALLYAECCERVSEAEGAPQPADVLATLALEVCVVAVTCGACAVYCRLGTLSSRDATTLALCAVPRALDTQWESAWCVSAGAVRLPGAFLAPAQALVLAVLVPDRPDQPDRHDQPDRSDRPDQPDLPDRPDLYRV